jgi:hypothetical protein
VALEVELLIAAKKSTSGESLNKVEELRSLILELEACLCTPLPILPAGVLKNPDNG